MVTLTTAMTSNPSLVIAPSFVDMYEKGDYVYAFFREITVEFEISPMHDVSEHLLYIIYYYIMLYRLCVHVLLGFVR